MDEKAKIIFNAHSFSNTTDGLRKGTEIRKHKTDIMAIFLKLLSLMKILCHCVIYHALGIILSVLLATLKEKLIYVLDQIFPEYHHAFSDIFGKTSK